MAREEVYEFTVNCHAHKEDVQLTNIDIGEDRMEVTFEDGHKLVFFSREEHLRILQQKYKIVKR